jgi:hypothetical protein
MNYTLAYNCTCFSFPILLWVLVVAVGELVLMPLCILYILFIAVAFLCMQFDLEDRLAIRTISPTAASLVSPAFGAMATGATYYATSGPRVAALAGAIGFSSVAVTYAAYTVLGVPHGKMNYLFF